MINTILEAIVHNGFVRRNLQKLNVDFLKIGPVGLLLLNNLKTEWFYNIALNKDVTVFLNRGDINETFEFAKNLCLDKLPFGIAEVQHEKKLFSTELIKYYQDKIKNPEVNFENFYMREENEILKCSVFVSPNNSTQFFHQWQRERRMWWRKFSPAPGKYSLTDIKNGENNKQVVEIIAKYPWGDQLLEIIELNTTCRNYTASQLQFKEGKKQVQAHIVSSSVNLITLFMNTLCDAYDEPKFQDKIRPLFRFHRKLAPYKISLSVTASNAAAISELKDLAVYLCKQLRTNHVSTLFLPSSSKHTLEAQFKQYDQLGIPYTVVLNEKTLVDGICHLRSRDTTLREQIHVAELVNYVEQLFKNY